MSAPCVGIVYDGMTLHGTLPCGCEWWADARDVRVALDRGVFPESEEPEHGVTPCAEHGR